MSVRESSRDRTPPTRVLEEQESDILDAMVDLTIESVSRDDIVDLREAVRKRKSLWETYSTTVMSLIPKYENEGRRSEAADVRKRFKERRQIIKTQIRELNHLRENLEDIVSDFTIASTACSEQIPSAAAVLPSLPEAPASKSVQWCDPLSSECLIDDVAPPTRSLFHHISDLNKPRPPLENTPDNNRTSFTPTIQDLFSDTDSDIPNLQSLSRSSQEPSSNMVRGWLNNHSLNSDKVSNNSNSMNVNPSIPICSTNTKPIFSLSKSNTLSSSNSLFTSSSTLGPISSSYNSMSLTTPFISRLGAGSAPRKNLQRSFDNSQSVGDGIERSSSNYIPYSNPVSSTFFKRQPVSTSYSDQNSQNQKPASSRSTYAEESANHTSMDAVAQFLLQKELQPTELTPFKGESHKFYSWINKIEAKLSNLPLSAQQKISILESNSCGEPQKLIRDYQDVCPGNPEHTLNRIINELHIRYGSPEAIFDELDLRLSKHSVIKDQHNLPSLRSLLHTCRLILCNLDFVPSFTYFDTPTGQKKVWLKLPFNLRDSWAKLVGERSHRGIPVTFRMMVEFIENHVDTLSRSRFYFNPVAKNSDSNIALKTSTPVVGEETPPTYSKKDNYDCSYHNTNSHKIQDCKAFKNLKYEERVKLVKQNRLCFRCLGHHFKKDCTSNTKCDECNGAHIAAMHDSSRVSKKENFSSGAENSPPPNGDTSSLCTHLCGTVKNKSCSKVLLIEVWNKDSSSKIRCYALLDEQSSASFISTKLAEKLNATGPVQEYSLTTLNGCNSKTKSQQVSNLMIQGVGEKTIYPLPKLLTNDFIPNCKDEIGTPEIVKAHPHIRKFSKNFKEIDPSANVHLLLGRDCNNIMKTTCYGDHYPYVHHTAIGWALVGSACPDSIQNTQGKISLRTAVTHEHFDISPKFASLSDPKSMLLMDSFANFKDDELPSLSADDSKFLQIVEDGTTIKEDGSIEIPLPFKEEHISLPDNKSAVFVRTNNTLQRLKLEPEKLKACIETLKKYSDANHVEEIPVEELPCKPGKVWYLPIFPVVHPKKGKVRLVFDSSAKYKGVSLNNTLLQGPDNNNSLRGVLLRFRDGPVAVSCDIETMFHSFKLPKEDQNYVRFFFFQDLDPSKKLVEFRMKAHCFGNTASPAVANFGLRRAASSVSNFDAGSNFLLNNVYVDDGLAATNTAEEAIQIVEEARTILSEHQIRLHKIMSNSEEVLKHFPPSEIAENKILELEKHKMHTALGITWNVSSDELTFQMKTPNSAFTKRGVLSVTNSIFDPLGIVSPVILTGRLLQRQFFTKENSHETYDWDDPLPSQFIEEWNDWKDSLLDLSQIKVTRSYHTADFGEIKSRELHTFSDASQVAIGHVTYLKLISTEGLVKVSLVSGNARVAPKAASTIPRLELCAALEAAKATTELITELKMNIDQVYYHCDSMIVLGYLNNSSKHFSRYVARRIEMILSMSTVDQWQYVNTSDNPADIATHSQTPSSLILSNWFSGPKFLFSCKENNTSVALQNFCFPDPLPEHDCKVMKVDIRLEKSPITQLCDRLSSWSFIIKVTKCIMSSLRWLDRARQRLGIQLAPRHDNLLDKDKVIKLIIKSNQADYLQPSTNYNDKILSMSPYTDMDGIVRVGGRLKHSFLPLDGKFPYIIPPDSPLCDTLIRHFHAKNFHQGRVITLAAIRCEGFHIVGCKRLVDKLIKQCVFCKRIRGQVSQQLMSDLPEQRLEEVPPFTNCGIDLCGPFNVKSGPRTRRAFTTKKVWAALFTCLVSRAIHIEIVSSCDTASFMMAIRRFFCIRGPSKYIRTDNAGNFLATRTEISSNIDLDSVTKDLANEGCKWVTNNPKASHEGGVWERKIRSIKSVLAASLAILGHRTLDIEELQTLFQEAAAVVNNTPLYPVSCVAGEPTPITPAMILTLRDAASPPSLENYTQKDIDSYGRNRWKRVQLIADEFWKRWRHNYLPTLQQRNKWKEKQPNIKVGDIVLLRDKIAPRNQWPSGVVATIRQGSDGLVRSVAVKVTDAKGSTRMFNRSIHDLVIVLAI